MSGMLANKVALVSGSGRGIGRAVVEKFASAGARVVVNDLDADVAAETVAVITASGGEAVAFAGDATAPDFGDRFVQAAVNAFGGIDIIVNNAGFGWDSILQKTSDQQWEAMLAVHLSGPFRVLRAAQPVIAAAAKAEIAADGQARRRSVVNISSIAGLGGNVGQAGYSAGKAGVVGLTKTVAKEWGRYGVTVNAVAFGIIGTRMTLPRAGEEMIQVGDRQVKVGMGAELQAALATAIPLGRPGTPQEAAGAVYLLCLHEASYITGEVIVCGGGYTL
ncbi:SDR family oxidoreductase [Sphingomonas sp. MG17]|uniref:SDR family oxidoreductase n=1 Tax=Sphingomonas tagetis TaxID=2949092 RepID=A0A9X2KL06_9SPHN|nr:SDR family oxidoreductase [Sphingomonas tagetis]MCP3730285.1 SDR family oxidoreductase [Sphingomonas tagetis]